MTVSKFSVLFLGFISGAALAQQASQTADELAKQTALLKAQQAYYDQLLATAKSQQAAADASLATQLATLSTANQLQVAQYANDLALATAVKGSGLTAAVGKEGTITTASADKTLLAFQQGSLKAVETLSSTVCSELQQRNISGAFVVPPNYELLVQKSVVDVMQLYALHDAAVTGIKSYGTVKMEVAGLALAGAMVTAQYLAGGIQSLSKLFRTDYNVSFTPINRQGLFEQVLSASCPEAVMNNVESRLRLNAAKILMTWIPDMAKFVQLNDAWSEIVSQRKNNLTSRRTNVAADATLSAQEKKTALKQIDDALAQNQQLEETLSKYKNVAASIKSYLSAMGTSSIYDSIVWGQEHLQKLGGLPGEIQDMALSTHPRISYNLNVQDAVVKSSSTFSSDKLKVFSTAEMYYSVVDANGTTLLTAVHSMTSTSGDYDIKKLQVPEYKKVY